MKKCNFFSLVKEYKNVRNDPENLNLHAHDSFQKEFSFMLYNAYIHVFRISLSRHPVK
jgi:hypothetical protein